VSVWPTVGRLEGPERAIHLGFGGQSFPKLEKQDHRARWHLGAYTSLGTQVVLVVMDRDSDGRHPHEGIDGVATDLGERPT